MNHPDSFGVLQGEAPVEVKPYLFLLHCWRYGYTHEAQRVGWAPEELATDTWRSKRSCRSGNLCAALWLCCHPRNRAPIMPSSWYFTTRRRCVNKFVRRGDSDRTLMHGNRTNSSVLRMVGVCDAHHSLRGCKSLPWGAIIAVVERHIADDVMRQLCQGPPRRARAAASVYAGPMW